MRASANQPVMAGATGQNRAIDDNRRSLGLGAPARPARGIADPTPGHAPRSSPRASDAQAGGLPRAATSTAARFSSMYFSTASTYPSVTSIRVPEPERT